MPKRTDISAMLVVGLPLLGCTSDFRPGLSEEQFRELSINCELPEGAVFKLEELGHPFIELPHETTDDQVSCIQAEQARIGATADMAIVNNAQTH